MPIWRRVITTRFSCRSLINVGYNERLNADSVPLAGLTTSEDNVVVHLACSKAGFTQALRHEPEGFGQCILFSMQLNRCSGIDLFNSVRFLLTLSNKSRPCTARKIYTWERRAIMKKFIQYVPYVFVTLIMLLGGLAKLTGQEMAIKSFADMGLPPWFATFIGVCEVAGAIGIWLPRLSSLAALGIAIIMVGAVYYHITFPPVQAGIPALLVLLSSIYIAARGRSTAFWKST